MSRHDDGFWPTCLVPLIGLVLIVGVFFWVFVHLGEEQERQQKENTPPAAATVATVNTGANDPTSPEATGRYVVETIHTSGTLNSSQDALVAWITAHPDLRLVEVVPITSVRHGIGGTSGFIIVAEARQP